MKSQLPSHLPHDLQIDLLQRLLQSHLIVACKFISKCGRSQPRSASLSSYNHGLHVHLRLDSITACRCISEFPRYWPPSACSHSLSHDLPENLGVNSISVSNYIFKLARAPPPSTSCWWHGRCMEILGQWRRTELWGLYIKQTLG